VFVTVSRSWWRREDGGGRRMVTVSALGLGVLIGAFVGLGFGYLGGVVVSAWVRCLRQSRSIKEGGSVACGLPEERNEEEKRNEEREKKS
jgi:hypothetical protein